MKKKPPAAKKKTTKHKIAKKSTPVKKTKKVLKKKIIKKPKPKELELVVPKVTFNDVYSWSLKIEYGGEYQDITDNLVKPNIIIGIRVLTERKTGKKIAIDLAGAPVNNFDEAAHTLLDRVKKWFQFHYPKQDPGLSTFILTNVPLKTKYDSWLKCKSQTLRSEMACEIGKY